ICRILLVMTLTALEGGCQGFRARMKHRVDSSAEF
ncbi:hypothetical protein A2U01_0022105, partial [Trifolium medium]|nr:hypothetical protein [Trifolium medium]